MTIILNGNELTFAEAKRIIYDFERVEVGTEAFDQVELSRGLVEQKISDQEVFYGINTGFGKLSEVVIPPDTIDQLQLNLIRSHAVGVGEPFNQRVVRGMLLLRANALAKGYSGVRKETLQLLIELLNHRIHPVIPSQGSLGASGDLAPLSHLALVLIGEGKVWTRGRMKNAGRALEDVGLSPIQLRAKEGLALINGTQAMTSVGLLTYLEGRALIDLADGIASLTVQALRGIPEAYSELVHMVRPYVEQQEVASRLRAYLEGSQLTTRQGQIRVQDAYSLRCIPQVHGATRQVFEYVKEKLLVEMNAATDNPLIFHEIGHIISGGNFHGQPIAFAMDFLGIALAEMANIAERRIERLVNPTLNGGLPPFLSSKPGTQSGLMIAQYTAASLVSENKTLAHPASVDSIPSSANQEDHVSMGTIAAKHAYQILENCRKVLAIEAFCAAQAIDFLGKEKLSPNSLKLYQKIRAVAPMLENDRVYSYDIEKLAKKMKEGEIRCELSPV